MTQDDSPAAPVAPVIPMAKQKPAQFRREKRDVHGWIVLDKPVGMTSTQAVGAIKRLFACRRAGHAGTLDPLASGVLPIALGEATKTVQVTINGDLTPESHETFKLVLTPAGQTPIMGLATTCP